MVRRVDRAGGRFASRAVLARTRQALQFVTGYVIELSLSVDNLFVFLVIFRYFKVPDEQQHGCCSGAFWAH